jgi:hypothetical protein
VRLSGSTLRRTLRAMGYRWKRPRFVLARKDPERAEKKGGPDGASSHAAQAHGRTLRG